MVVLLLNKKEFGYYVFIEMCDILWYALVGKQYVGKSDLCTAIQGGDLDDSFD